MPVLSRLVALVNSVRRDGGALGEMQLGAKVMF